MRWERLVLFVDFRQLLAYSTNDSKEFQWWPMKWWASWHYLCFFLLWRLFSMVSNDLLNVSQFQLRPNWFPRDENSWTLTFLTCIFRVTTIRKKHQCQIKLHPRFTIRLKSLLTALQASWTTFYHHAVRHWNVHRWWSNTSQITLETVIMKPRKLPRKVKNFSRIET